MNNHKFLGFSNSLDTDDYGVIVSKEGRLKGVWLPIDCQNEPIPQTVVDFCITNFGIDPNNDQLVSQTVH